MIETAIWGEFEVVGSEMGGMEKREKRAVVLLSGGLDSTVTAYIAKNDIGKRGELLALNFEYGQRHSREVESAVKVAEALRINLTQLEVPFGCLVAASSLIKGSREEIPAKGVASGIPSTWVPQRNSIFLALAFAFAETVDADSVYVGMNYIDYSGYPDCRPEFVSSINKALNLASKRFVETGRGIGIIAPLMYLSKKEIVLKGLELGVDFSLTTSCYQGRERACGYCDSCRIRLLAFRDAGIADPIEYEEV